MPDKYFDALKRYYELTKWEMYQDNPDYIKETIHSDYWWAKSHNDESKFGLYILIAISRWPSQEKKRTEQKKKEKERE